MKHFIFLTILLLCSLSNFAYKNKVDSVRTAYVTAKGNAKIDAAINYACYLAPPDTMKAMLLFQEALKESKASKYIDGQIKVFHYMGWYYFEYLHNRDKAILMYQKAIQLAKEHKNYDELLGIYANLSDIYIFIGNNIEAINTLNESQQYAEKINPDKYLSIIYIGLMECYASIGDFEKAYSTFSKGVTLSRKTKDIHNLWLLYTAMADMKYQEKKYFEALAFINKAIEYGTKNNEFYAVLNLQAKVDVLIQCGRIKEAEKLCLKIRPTMKTIPAFDFIGSNNASLGHIYAARKEYKKAVEYLLLSYQETVATDNNENLIDLDSTLSNAYYQLGDYKKSVDYLKYYFTHQEEISSERKQKEFQNLQHRFDLEKNQLQLTNLESSKKMYIVLSITLFFILILGIIVFFIKHTNNQLQVKLLDETAKNEEQLRENIQLEMDTKLRELTSMAMAIDQKNIIWKNIQQKLKETLNEMPTISEKEIKTIVRIITQDNDNQHEWDTFKLHFENVHPQFFTTLRQIAPTLTQLELRQCAYIKINLAPKQVGNLLNITPDSVKKSRMRLKKKLNLSAEENLSKFITNLKIA
ncbi:hypothetical protein VB796_18075 [Arcicella sp. LKC2W]|uniref:tetratricopeptide repeat protein n=1 Tax=Arcicella sp. LKC2W TaxID=2984198 RepID=UPI002B1EC466|nr:hypothetical protein [Arcicella sp. LKC2W]MEA5460974.1 hypothetical protein [Arcicella sp. LKC2W]